MTDSTFTPLWPDNPTDEAEMRRRLWHNFGALLKASDILNRMPRVILAALATAGYDG
jgi:hypothetical protein